VERGEAAVATNGKRETVSTEMDLADAIMRHLKPKKSKRSFQEHLSDLVVMRWREKLGAFSLVCLYWLLLAGQQDFKVAFSPPVDLRNMPQTLELKEPFHVNLRLTARGMRKDASTLGSRNVSIKIDLGAASSGPNVYTLSCNHINLPNDRIDMVQIEPAEVMIRHRPRAAAQPNRQP